jgi:hypothetical protein
LTLQSTSSTSAYFPSGYLSYDIRYWRPDCPVTPVGPTTPSNFDIQTISDVITKVNNYQGLEVCIFVRGVDAFTQKQTVKYDLSNHYFLELFKKYKDYEGAKMGDRCIEIQYMKFIWFLSEDMSYDYYFWIDAGLSHCGLIPNKYLAKTGIHNSQYYESPLFNNDFLRNLVKNTEDKFTIIGKENDRNYWSGTVDPKWYVNYDRSIHIIGGMFGGHRDKWDNIVTTFENYVQSVLGNDNGYVKYTRQDPFLNYQPIDLIDYGVDQRGKQSIELTNENLKLSGSVYSLIDIDYNKYRYRFN